ncbi:MAG: hypothetical protein KF767_06525 [Bdellovibrionaceae bacterium]|nr:hypothetical protein [Pseudobdellovibrionaceae bacterium]
MALRTHFEKGEYLKALEVPLARQRPEDLPWLLGSAIFVGDWPRAQAAKQRIPGVPSLLAPTLYFEALGALRRSEYGRARSLMKRNLAHRERLKDFAEEFFIDQGPALYFYFRGNFEKSARFGEKAFVTAERHGFTWGEVVSRDLLAHVYFHLGRVRTSFDYFERASRQAEKLGNESLVSAIEVSHLKYACQVGLWGGESIRRLEDSIAALKTSDTYSRAEFLMELSRQRVLRGQLTRAEEALKDAFHLVHQFQNKRQTARLNFRLAFLQYLRGQDLAALGILRSGMVLLDPQVDHLVMNEMRGLEARLLKQPPPLIDEADAVFWQKRLNARAVGRTNMLPLGEDPLGDLMDLIEVAPEKAAPVILREEYWGLLPRLLGLDRSDNALIVGFIPKGLALSAAGEITVKRQGLTNLMARLIRSLSGGLKSKEELVTEVWGYQYDPLRHDSLLHRALATLRKLLAPQEDWLQFDGESYRLHSSVKLHDRMNLDEAITDAVAGTITEPTPEPTETVAAAAKNFDYDTKLNHRQNLFLKNWPADVPIDVQTYAESFQVSVPSATRDLTGLHQAGRVHRVGRARSTRYLRR